MNVSAISEGVVSAGGVLAGKILLFTVLLFLVWGILTAIVMLLFANKSKKRGVVIGVFCVSSVLFLITLVVLYFEIDKLLSVLKIGGII
jgi:hypothetical protein